MLAMPVRGRVAMQDLLANVIGRVFDPFKMEVRALYPGADGQTLVAEYASDAVVKHNGRPYVNRYVGIFRFDGDQIAFWREYHNPEAATAALS
jgi:ketosteroid isomerase-like protein